MSNDIGNRMVVSQMERMSSLFQKAATELEQTVSKMTQIASQLQNGALQGKAGSALSDAINKDLNTSLNRLREKMTELTRDINGAIANHREGVTTNATRFK